LSGRGNILNNKKMVINPAKIGHNAGLILFILIIILPLIFLMLKTGSSPSGEWLELVLPRGRRLKLLLDSITMAVVVSAASTIAAFIIAALSWRWQKGFLFYLKWLFLLMILVPAYIHSMAWDTAFNQIDCWLLVNNLPGVNFSGWPAALLVQFMYLLPIAAGIIMLGFQSLNPLLIEAAQVFAPNRKVWMRVILPICYPVIMVSAGILFLLTLIDYSIPSLFQVSTYALEIFAEFSASNDLARVLALSFPLLLITVPVIISTGNGLRNTVLKPEKFNSPIQNIPIWPREWQGLKYLALVLIILQVGLPLAVILRYTGSLSSFFTAVSGARAEIVLSIEVAALTALCAIPPALSAAKKVLAKGRISNLWWVITTLPLALPAPLVGIALIAFFNNTAADYIYGSMIMPVLASLMRFLPLTVLVLAAYMKRINPGYLEAAAVFQKDEIQGFFKVFIPFMLPGLLAAFGLVFALSSGELGATLLVAPPGKATLTMKIYNYLHYGATDTVAGLCAAFMIITLLLAIMVIILRGFFSKKLNGRAGTD